jgi:hypothetical protein
VTKDSDRTDYGGLQRKRGGGLSGLEQAEEEEGEIVPRTSGIKRELWSKVVGRDLFVAIAAGRGMSWRNRCTGVNALAATEAAPG